MSTFSDSCQLSFRSNSKVQSFKGTKGTNCTPLVADLSLYSCERDVTDSLNHDNQADVSETFNSTSRYLDVFLNTDNPYFEDMVSQICPPGLQLSTDNTTYTEAPFLHLHLSIAKWICFI